MHKFFSFPISLSWLIFLVFLALPGELPAQNRRVARADEAFAMRQYHDAANLYRRAYNRVRRKDRKEATRITFQAAMCYRYTQQSRLAESWFRRAVRMNYPDPIAVLYLAEALMQNEKFDEAATQYARFIELAPDDWRGPAGLASVEIVPTLIDNPTPYEVEAVRIFNSREDDYSSAFGDHRASALIFASSREDALGRDNDRWTGQKHTSLFVSYQDRNGVWGRPVLLDEGPVNTEFNEGAPSVNTSATTMFFTRCLPGTDKDIGCRIFRSSREGANWAAPQEIKLTSDSLVTVGHPAISPDELSLYFVSDMPGSIGTKDIWVARRRAPGDEFGPPENLGPVINTPGNEMFPFVREDGTLYFASDGHPGMGGLDIFMAKRSPDGWEEPVNLGVPINSAGDDFGIVFQAGREQGFFSSNRSGSRGYDIYSFYLAPFEFMIAGTILDDSTRVNLEGAMIQLVGSDGSIFETESDVRGRYVFERSQVREHVNYDLLVGRRGYFSARAAVSTMNMERSTDFEVDVMLTSIPLHAIELPEILYEFARWELQPQFQDSLNGLVQTLRDNPNLVIELASHTDSRGTHEVNDTLSFRRAQVVVDYLIGQGIAADRLEAAGYGKRVPRTIERDIVREGFLFKAGTVMTEEYINALPTEAHRDAAHQLNRRTEFRVLHDQYVPSVPPGSSPSPGRTPSSGGSSPGQGTRPR